MKWLPVLVVAAALVRAQEAPEWQVKAGGKMAFEVAAIKMSEPGKFRAPNFPLDAGDAYAETGGRFFASFPLYTYIRFAYKISPTSEQMQAMIAHLPKWVATDSFVIEAKAEGNPTKDQMRLMMQSLLADRFKLAAHFETQESPVYALVLAKPGKLGPNLHRHEDGPACDAPASDKIFPYRCEVTSLNASQSGATILGSRNTTIPLIAATLPSLGRLGRPVVDRTGLSGKFDFKLEWAMEPLGPPPAADARADPQGPSLEEALREQLGFKLEATRAALQILVIDRVERPTEN